MSEHPGPASAPHLPISEAFEAKIDAALKSNEVVMNRVGELLSVQVKISESISEIRERVLSIAPMLNDIRDTQVKITIGQDNISKQLDDAITKIEIVTETTKEDIYKNFGEQQAKLRSVLLGKMDGLQGTMDLLRERVQNSWNTADFAITNTRSVRNDASDLRDEADKLLAMISTMQRQQNLLESQVEILRRNAVEKDENN